MDRRAFLRSTGIAASAAAFVPLSEQANAVAHNSIEGLSTHAEVGAKDRDQIASTLTPWAPSASQPWDMHTINHLYRRAGFGATMKEISSALLHTPGEVIDALLDDTLTLGVSLPPPPRHSDQWLTKFQSDFTQSDWDASYLDIRTWWSSLMAQPEAMLREKMVLFWANHFVVELQKVNYSQSCYHYLDYFRQHPWGNFKQMVKDVTVLPAMVIYLDGWFNHKDQPNENYARELMELFTLGLTDRNGNANYHEEDIHEFARALTGCTVNVLNPAPNPLPFWYDQYDHDDGVKKPFAWLTNPPPERPYGLDSSGQVSADNDIINVLFDYRGDGIAHFICGKLYQYFVYHDITTTSAQDVIAQLAETFKSNNWELKPVIAQLLKSERFFDETNIGAAIKSPYEYMVGMCRSLDVSIDELQGAVIWRRGLTQFQQLLAPPNVKGWPGYHDWVSTTTLPERNSNFAHPLVVEGMIDTGETNGYNEKVTPLSFDDASLIAWAKQFQNYLADLDDFILELCTFFCATVPSGRSRNEEIKNRLPANTYEWPTLTDQEKINPLRTILINIMLLAEYQLN